MLPFKYFQQHKLNYDRLYFDLLSNLLINEWNFKKYNHISINLDNFNTHTLNKKSSLSKIKNSLKNKYTDKYFRMQFTDSDKNLNLQLADFIVGTFFKNFTKSQKIPEFNLNNLKAKIISNIL